VSGRRPFALGAALAGALAVAAVLLLAGEDSRYLVRMQLDDAGGLRQGANVRLDGVPAGKVTDLELDRDDRVLAELRIDDPVAPVGRDARGVIQVDGIFGERYVDLKPGDRRRPAAPGTVIPRSRTSVSVRLDDVVDALDLDTRQALGVFMREQGTALVGRGRELSDMLASLPPTLDSTGALLAELGAENRALGRLVDQSDRVLVAVARERRPLGRLVQSAGGALDTLASRRRELGETVRRAPATLRSARRTLASLEGASLPLIPAARGLRATAPPLTRTLRELPGFARASVPTLASLRRLGPPLGRLGREGAPVVRRLRPLSRDLVTYAGAANPFTDTLDRVSSDLFGVMEGWARSTQPRDAASHVFRFGLSTDNDTFALLFGPPAYNPGARDGRSRRGGARAAPAPEGARVTRPAPRAPGRRRRKDGLGRLRLPDLPELERAGAELRPQGDESLLDFLLGP
jgi:virulence factor Mce-like protein